MVSFRRAKRRHCSEVQVPWWSGARGLGEEVHDPEANLAVSSFSPRAVASERRLASERSEPCERSERGLQAAALPCEPCESQPSRRRARGSPRMSP